MPPLVQDGPLLEGAENPKKKASQTKNKPKQWNGKRSNDSGLTLKKEFQKIFTQLGFNAVIRRFFCDIQLAIFSAQEGVWK